MAEPQAKESQSGIFTNKFGEVRSGWKVALLWVLFLGSGFFLGFLSLIVLIAMNGRNMNGTPIFNSVSDVIMELCGIGSVLFMVYVVERSRLRNFGLPSIRPYAREVLYGILWGAGTMIFIFLVLFLTGNVEMKYSLGQPQWTIDSLFMLILMILVGFSEEMMSRGYTMTVLQRQTGKRWLAVGVSSLIFAAMHLLNPNVSAFGIMNIAFFGVVAACMYIRTGSLWMPIAYHASWDYFEGNVFGFPNSGNTLPSLYPFAHVKSNLLTGGGFGPEGGILVTAALLLLLIWVMKVYKPRHDVDLKTA
jgi:uncharacterized protein